MSDPFPVVVEGLEHAYGEHRALDGVSFDVRAGELFAFLGPNGSGKTTLFRILSTLMPPAAGQARVFGFDVRAEPAAVRARIGVVFQSPALDDMLTVEENLRHHGRMHGLGGRERRQRMQAVLAGLGLADRPRDRVAVLSGGLKRRVDLARGLLHSPQLLILDEPSTGLDPGARRDFWEHLQEQRRRTGLTVLLTTHLMEEGDRCDRVAILDRGRLVGLGSPAALCRDVGDTVISIRGADPDRLRRQVAERFGLQARLVDGALRIQHPDGHSLVPELAAAFRDRLAAVTVQAPTLEDVFVHRTGHRFRDEPGANDGGTP